MRVLLVASLVIAMGALSCGPGWEGYEGGYSAIDDAPPPAEWEGDQAVFVRLGDLEIELPLAGMTAHDYLGVPAVRLSDLIEASAIVEEPADYRYNFTASDGYDLLAKRREDPVLLPDWEDLGAGYLYDQDDLTVGWSEHSWGSAVSAYQIKYMNGGIITLIPG